MTDGSKRIIPVVLIKNGYVVQSYGFRDHPIIGDPLHTLQRLLTYQADEVMILDISSNTSSVSLKNHRGDLAFQGPQPKGIRDLISQYRETLLFPVAAGGGLTSLDQAKELISVGADKIVLNQAVFGNSLLIKECAEEFGSQAVVVSIDVVEAENGFEVFDYSNLSVRSGVSALPDLLAKIESLGCGEIYINNVSRDGTRTGQNSSLIALVANSVTIPFISGGGIGSREDFVSAFAAGATAVAASNFFHSHELSYPKVKEALRNRVNVREYLPRERLITRELLPIESENRAFLANRLDKSLLLQNDYGHYFRGENISFKRCSVCVYPSTSATALSFDSKFICSGCEKAAKTKEASGLRPGFQSLVKIVKDHRPRATRSEYDCIVAVSGGKDSYFQTHFVIEELGLKPLLVTYNANNWTARGRENLERMRTVFGVDHIEISPPAELLGRMNLAGLLMMGDMSWHAHVGIFSTPMKLAAEMDIPLVFYGEHGREDLAGQFRFGDFPEITYRERAEHHARGFEWDRFQGVLGITSDDLSFWKYPSDESLFTSGVRGLHIGTFIDWDPHKQTELIKGRYGFRTADVPFRRTYRMGSNLDDMHENGLHDWLKYIKFGYGRGTDHGSKDVRLGKLARVAALELAKHHDASMSEDLGRWLAYAGISENLFYLISNSFRSEEVWKFSKGRWVHPDGMEDTWGAGMPDGAIVELKTLRKRVAAAGSFLPTQ
jgi:imidazoleglycerol phosphate synthase cyclase subunit